MKPHWSLYMVRTGRGELYTGISTDVVRRFAEHQSGRGAKYLRGRGPLRLVYTELVGSRSDALKAESKMKRFSRVKKEMLIKACGELL